MPELPEVETIRRVLERKLAGRRVLSAEVRRPRTAGSRLTRELAGHKTDLAGRLQGRRVKAVRRRAKYLVIELDQGALLVHLGMTGQFFAAKDGQQPASGLPPLPDKHTHLIIDFTGSWHLYFRDIRKFGSLRWLRDREEERAAFAGLGPEPLDPAFTPEELSHSLHGKKAPVKALLLNQKVIAGVGNIYADEALFRARLAPQVPAGSLAPPQIRRLHAALREVLAEAIRFRGTTMSDYFDPESRRGGFQDRLRVYGREGGPCPACGRPVAKGVVAQRGTHWCPQCQKRGSTR
ncbi:MAG: bifunctional DNA-formamidopyrimidine glycosylase/DNA-(apurinic or apyrimidinic site) lyase [candidate division FCPU426 bacterium]